MERANQDEAVMKASTWAEQLAEARKTFFGLLTTTLSEREVWAVETVKHIALVALAGLAGVFALLQANKGDARLAVWAALAFSLGSAVCVASLYLGAWGRKQYAEKVLLPVLNKIAAGKMPEISDVKPPWLATMNRFIFGVGFASALLTMAGGVILFLALP